MMADFILPVMLIIGGLCWLFLLLVAESMRPVPRGEWPGFVGPAAVLIGAGWLTHSIWGVI